MLVSPEIFDCGKKIRVIYVPAEGFKTSLVTISLLVPRAENLAENIILPRYLTYCSKKYPLPTDLSACCESLYGTVVSGTVVRKGESSRVELSATCIDSRFSFDGEDVAGEVLELMLELLFNPLSADGRLAKEPFELQKRLAIERIESEANDKRLYAFTRMTEIMCEDEVFGISRQEILDSLKSTDEVSVFNAWKKLLKTATVQINLIGSFDREKSLKIIKEKFESVEREPVENDTVFVESAEDVTEVTEEMDINQSKLVLGYRSGMKDRNDKVYARQVFTDVFGGGPYSRLFMNVREKLSLCYYCSARLHREKGIIVIQSGIERENREKVLGEINNQLEIMRSNQFDDADFNASKTAICDSLRGVFDTPEGIDSYLNSKIDEELIPIDEVIKGYEAVTREDVVKSAEELSLDTVYMLAGREAGADE
jgi:predicted Zn-dependent peptidase